MRLHMLTENTMVKEDLGNLAALNLGPLIGILKQDTYNGIGKKFNKSGVYGLGNTSKIIDGGVLKNGLQTLRKAYRDANEANSDGSWTSPKVLAFALYIDSKAVAFGLFDSDALAGRTRTGMFSYDLRQFEDIINQEWEKENAELPSWRQNPKPTATSMRDKEDYHYPRGYHNEREPIIRKFAGTETTTNDLGAFIDKLDKISKLIGKPITFKLATSDSEGYKRGNERRNLNPREVRSAAEDLKNRLVKYKNSKRPTAENIHQFIEMVTKRAASVINFSGKAWKADPKTAYDSSKIDPAALLAGKPFNIEYGSAEPGNYNSIKLSYRYDPKNNTITPWQAEWNDDKHHVIPLDLEYWTRNQLKVPDLEKPTVIKKMLTMIKESPNSITYKAIERSIQALRKMGNDWPEFAVIEKSIAAERAKEEAKRQQD